MTTREEVMATSDYEPYDHRVRPGQINRFETFINLIKGILGTGILAMPQGFKHSGFVFGTIGNIVITMIVTYCLHLLFRAMYFFCKRDKIPIVTYPEAMKEGLLMGPEIFRKLAPAAPYVVNFFIILNQTGLMCIYLIFTASNIKQVFDLYISRKLGLETYMIILLLPFMVITFIKDLKKLAPFSTVANWITVLALFCMYYYFFKGLGPMTDRSFFAHIKTYPLFMGTTMMAVISIGCILSVELNMKQGQYYLGWFGVLSQAMFVVTILDVFTGYMGYWRYGDKTDSSITLNIDINDGLAQAIRVLFSIAIYISYGLQSYPMTEIIWDDYVKKHMETSQNPLLWNYIIRAITVLLSFLLAISIPRLGSFISLKGAFCLAVLGIIFPPFLDLCTYWPDVSKWIITRDILLIIFGLSGWIFGTYSAIRAIAESF